MTTEEKTSCYDEAIYNNYKSFTVLIERLESVKSAIKEHNYGIAMDILYKPYPDFQVTTHPELKESEDLEKQGEQKLVQETEPTPIFKIGDILKRKGKDYTFRVDRIQGGYYHCDRNHGAFFPIEEQGLWQLVAQKPAWSEEDEFELENVLCHLRNYLHKDSYIRYENWLKSLRPQSY